MVIDSRPRGMLIVIHGRISSLIPSGSTTLAHTCPIGAPTTELRSMITVPSSFDHLRARNGFLSVCRHTDDARGTRIVSGETSSFSAVLFASVMSGEMGCALRVDVALSYPTTVCVNGRPAGPAEAQDDLRSRGIDERTSIRDDTPNDSYNLRQHSHITFRPISIPMGRRKS